MKISDQGIVILILAAGSSSRMGQPKQLLPWKNTTLLKNAIQNAVASRCKKVIVVLGANAEIIRKEISGHHIEIIENLSWESGLGSSIAAGVAFILKRKPDFDGVLIMLADQPLIDTAYLDLMIGAFLDRTESIIATAYKNGAGVPALFDKKYSNELVRLANDDQGARNIIARNGSEVFTIDPKDKSVDIDTKSEYEELINKMK